MAPFLSKFLVSVAILLRPVIGQTSSIDYCQALVDVLSICEAETPSFSALPATAQAGCLCGSQLGTLSWGPATFDGLAASCAVQYATIDVTIANDASQLEGFCTSFAGPQNVAAATTTPAVIPQTTASAFPSNTNTGPSTSPTSTDTFSSSPATVVSVITVSSTTSTSTPTSSNAAIRAQYQESDYLGVGLTMGALLLGGYVMA